MAAALRLRSAWTGKTGRLAEARADLEKALELLDAEDPLTNTVRVELASVQYSIGQIDQAPGLLRAAADAAKQQGDLALAVDALTSMASMFNSSADASEAEIAVDEAAALLEGVDAPELECGVARLRSLVAFRAGRSKEAVKHLERALALARASGNRDIETISEGERAAFLWRRGQVREAMHGIRNVAQMHRDAGRYIYEAHALSNLVRAYMELGDLEESHQCARRCVTLALRVDDPQVEMNARIRLATIRAAQGFLAEAEQEGRRGLEVADIFGSDFLWARMANDHLDVLAEMHRLDEAEALSQRVVEIATRGKDQLALAQFVGAQGLIAEARGDFPAALDLYREGNDRLAAGGVTIGRTRRLLAIARCLLVGGDLQEAWTCIEQALPAARETQSPPWEVMAQVYAALLPDGDVLVARLALERDEAMLPVRDRIEAHTVLWHATGEDRHLRRAREHIAFLCEHAHPEDRDGVRAGAPLRRAVQEGARLFPG